MYDVDWKYPHLWGCKLQISEYFATQKQYIDQMTTHQQQCHLAWTKLNNLCPDVTTLTE